MDYRQCTGCKNIKPLNQFKAFERNNVEYHVHQCKQCTSDENKIREQNYKEKRETNIRLMPIPNYKFCTKCFINKPITDFRYRLKRDYYVYNSSCIECEKSYNKIRNPIYYQNHREEILKYQKEYAQNHREEINNRCKFNYQNNPDVSLKNKLRNSILGVLKRGMSYTLDKYLECSFGFFKAWLQFQFVQNMNWFNQGSYWHINHVLPVSCFDFTIEQIICTNWINLRPLETKENLSKHNKIDMTLYNNQLIKAEYFKIILNNASPSNFGNLLKSCSTTSSELRNSGND